jgi:phosphoribosylamine--glycine ligase
VLPAAQDHKRIFAGDQGPNTGGMGTYAPPPAVDAALTERVTREIFEPTVRGMAEEGTPFRGVLFAGLMITDSGPVLLEFNVRFGDPETQVLMPLVRGDFAGALLQAATGQLESDVLSTDSGHALCVVLASHGYPGTPRKGDVIRGVEDAGRLTGVTVYHAGTQLEEGQLGTAGGRVLGVTAHADTLAGARALAYQAADLIHFDGKQMRRDIGARALGEA